LAQVYLLTNFMIASTRKVLWDLFPWSALATMTLKVLHVSKSAS